MNLEPEIEEDFDSDDEDSDEESEHNVVTIEETTGKKVYTIAEEDLFEDEYKL